jgi:hypothetical protein
MADSEAIEPRSIFVYGSLRPDDDSGMSWTKPFSEGMECVRARAYNAALFEDEYACAVLGDGTQGNGAGEIVADTPGGKKAITSRDFVTGSSAWDWVLR